MTKKLSQDSSFPVEIIDKSKGATSNSLFLENKLLNTLNNNYITKINEARLENYILDHLTEKYFIEEHDISIVTEIVMKPFSESVRRLWNTILFEFNKSDRKYPDCNFPLEDYINNSRFKSKREAVTQLKIDLEILQHTSLVLKQESTKKNNKIWNNNLINQGIKLFKTTAYIKNVIHFQFHEEFFDLLKDWVTHVPIDIKLFQLSLKYSPAYYMGLRMYNHVKMNVGKHNENTISVKSLLETNPALPREEEVKYGLKKGIMIPFEKNLEVLCKQEILEPLGYEYCNKEGGVLTEKQLEIMNYKTFKNLYIKFSLYNYNNQRIQNLKAKVKAKTSQNDRKITKRITNDVTKKILKRLKHRAS